MRPSSSSRPRRGLSFFRLSALLTFLLLALPPSFCLPLPLLFPGRVGYPFVEELPALPSMEAGPDDGKTAYIPIGELRRALQYKEAYDALVEHFDKDVVPRVNALAEDRNTLSERYSILLLVSAVSVSLLAFDLAFRR